MKSLYMQGLIYCHQGVQLWGVILIFFIVILGCSSRLALRSQWRDHQIVIDGARQDWIGTMTFLEKENITVGFMNDKDYLYVSLSSSHRDLQRQIIAMGFTIWFDPEGGQEKDFGIKFPVGMMESGLPMRGRGGIQDPQSRRQHLEKLLQDLEIIMPGEKDVYRMGVAEARGIEVKVHISPENFVYELRVPLHKSEQHPYAIAARTGKTIGVGFETTKLDLDKILESRRRSGFGGRRGDGRGVGRRGGFGRPQPEQFKLWVALKLDSEKEATSVPPIDNEKIKVQQMREKRNPARQRSRSDGAPRVGDMAPTFRLKSLDGKSETDLASFRGKKPVVLFFGSYT